MAEAAVDQMHLGTQNRIDFLGVSFSAMDIVGHAYGPRSHEIQDVLARLDISIGKLLDHLDQKVGAGNYVVAMTSDHGVADLPDGTAGGRQPGATVLAVIEAAIKPALGGEGPFIAALSGNDIYFKPGIYERLKADPETLHAATTAGPPRPGGARRLAREKSPAPARR